MCSIFFWSLFTKFIMIKITKKLPLGKTLFWKHFHAVGVLLFPNEFKAIFKLHSSYIHSLETSVDGIFFSGKNFSLKVLLHKISVPTQGPNYNTHNWYSTLQRPHRDWTLKTLFPFLFLVQRGVLLVGNISRVPVTGFRIIHNHSLTL